MDDKHARLRKARLAAGFESAADAARANRWSVAGYRHHENGTAGWKDERAREYARAYRVSAQWLIFGIGTGPDGEVAASTESGRPVAMVAQVPVLGSVEAGIWHEVAPTEAGDATEHLTLDVSGFDPAQLFALKVMGPSMNAFYPPGRFVIAASPAVAGLRSGDHVIVQRSRAGLHETTIKEYVRKGDTVEMWPRSTDPRFQSPIIISGSRDDQDAPEIIGVVVADYSRRERPSTH